MPDRRQISAGGAVSKTSELASASSVSTAGSLLDTSSLFWGLLFGSIGLGFLVYGRKQRAVIPLLAGLALIIFPYFVTNTLLLITIGIALIAIPYFVRL